MKHAIELVDGHAVQGTGFATMPRGLTAEVEIDRYEAWAAARGQAWLRETRITLEDGPFAGWAWDTSLIPDRFLAEGGQYRPLFQSNEAILGDEPVTYIWAAATRIEEAMG